MQVIGSTSGWKEPAGVVQDAGPSARPAAFEFTQTGGPVCLTPVPEDQGATANHMSPLLETDEGGEDVMGVFIPPRRLLVLDDDPLVRKTLAHLLRNAGHTVEEADDGAAGLAILCQRPVDLVLTDLGMPGLTGWEVARAVKAQSPHLPVVLVTGWADTIATEHKGRAFVDAILPKPCRFQVIQTVIGRLTGRADCTAVH